MEKTINCPFCGKAITAGIFSSESNYIMISLHSIECCNECAEKYEKEVKRITGRFETKLDNYKKATKKKPDNHTLAKFLLRYLEEEKEQIARCGMITETDKADVGYFAWNKEKSYFAMREFGSGSDDTAGQMAKNIKKAENVGKVWFNKDDITKLEYRTTLIGDPIDFFSTAYSFEIRFNDEKVMTYKPCISKVAFIGVALFPHTQKKKAKQQCVEFLTLLKTAIGSDLPIVEVKKFE